MPLLTSTAGPIDFRYETVAPATAAVRGSLALRIDAGNVGLFQNTDGTATGWRALLSAGGSVTFDQTANATWTLRDNSTTAWSIGATGDTDMLVFDTSNGAERLIIGATSGMLFNDDIPASFGTATNNRFSASYSLANNRFQLVGTAVTAAGVAAVTRPMRFTTGNAIVNDAAAGGTSGLIQFLTGNTDSTNAGGTGGATGLISFTTGDATGTIGASGASGVITLTTGTSDESTSGNISLTTGNVTAGAGASGSIVLTTGTSAGGTRGSIQAIGQLTTTDGVAAGTARRVGGAVLRTVAESAAVSNVEAIYAGGTYTIPTAAFQVGTRIYFEALVRVSAIAGANTAQIRIRIGGLAGTLAFDTTARTVADEDMITIRGRLFVRAIGAGGTATGDMTYFISAPDALASAGASEWAQDVAGSAAGTWTVAIDTTANRDLVITGQTDGAGTTTNLEYFYVDLNG